ncbi:hypothetical protein EXU48_06115 [Occultella glacieicola]|uniref:ABC transporter permease n=1 Tax=Occultella glacieicola TaxID=2518684 RepID=A0ABY2E5I9_9MICO|nr:hypothetical protein [Occultella glacieicola]TDE95834.1 hypothetical protein EXU48_06115 [Occultella glacieicola]
MSSVDGATVRIPYRTPARVWQFVAFGLACAAIVVLLVLPLYSGTRSTPDGTEDITATLLEVNGPGALVPMLVPVLLTAVPLLVPSGRLPGVTIACAALLVFLMVLGGATIGLFYAPAAIAAVVALLARRR